MRTALLALLIAGATASAASGADQGGAADRAAPSSPGGSGVLVDGKPTARTGDAVDCPGR